LSSTPIVGPRVPPELLDAARKGAKRAGAPDAPVSVLVRAGLLVLAGVGIREALAQAQAQARPGPKPKAEARA
jgi:hypothetical protein